jgi:hypothetical protein
LVEAAVTTVTELKLAELQQFERSTPLIVDLLARSHRIT